MKKILVTGASGLIGRHVVEELNKTGKYEVIAVVSGRRKVGFPEGVVVETANLLDMNQQNALLERVRPDTLCHYAWALDNGGFQTSEKNLCWHEASIHLLRTFARFDGQTFLFAGSSAEYGSGTYGNNPALKPVKYSLYGQCKKSFEEIATVFSGTRDIHFITSRYFSVYGPWDVRPDSAIPTAISTLMKGEDFVCKSPENLWDYVFVKDCAEATRSLLESKVSGSYNIATGHAISMREVFTTIARLLHREELIHFEEKKEQLMLLADVSDLERDTGYRCMTSFEAGMQETIKWWLERGQ